jgi:probable F420-dependent oxidoreductase
MARPVPPFRFLAEAGAVTDGRALAETARRAEATGIDVLVIADHLINQLAPIPAMATIAAATERLRIGTFVLNNDLRHPAVLAQDLASLDVLSGGRLEIGIGAGWNAPEYEAIGLPFDAVGTRVARLEEAIAVLKGSLGRRAFSFHGAHYAITDLDAQPKPIQRPHPPFFIGGGGRRLLSLAGREGDIVGLAPRLLPGVRGDPRSITIAATQEKIAWVREAAAKRFDRIELNIYPSMSPIIVTDHARRAASRLARRLADRTGVELSPDELLDSPHIFIGSIDQLVEKFRGLRERLGVSSIMVGRLDELPGVVERLAGT